MLLSHVETAENIHKGQNQQIFYSPIVSKTSSERLKTGLWEDPVIPRKSGCPQRHCMVVIAFSFDILFPQVDPVTV